MKLQVHLFFFEITIFSLGYDGFAGHLGKLQKVQEVMQKIPFSMEGAKNDVKLYPSKSEHVPTFGIPVSRGYGIQICTFLARTMTYSEPRRISIISQCIISVG